MTSWTSSRPAPRCAASAVCSQAAACAAATRRPGCARSPSASRARSRPRPRARACSREPSAVARRARARRPSLGTALPRDRRRRRGRDRHQPGRPRDRRVLAESPGRRALVHVDIDARQIGKSYEPTHAVVASASEFLAALGHRLATRRCGCARCMAASSATCWSRRAGRPDRGARRGDRGPGRAAARPRSSPSTRAITFCSPRTTSRPRCPTHSWS